MQFSTEQYLDGVLERRFTIDEVPGVLWAPQPASNPVPLILIGHPGGALPMYPRLAARAKACVGMGYAAATIPLPGSEERPPLAEVDAARRDLRQAVSTGAPVDNIVERLVLPLVERSVPEWQTTIDALLGLPDVGGPIGISGGIMAVAIRLAAVDSRIVAAGLFAGNFVPRSTFDDARGLTIPIHMLLQWDDEGNDRQMALDLFDAFGSTEKTLQANLGGHTGVPSWAGEDAGRFFARHLGQPAPTMA